MQEVKPFSASELTLSQIMGQNDTNLMGTVHGGVMMKLVDSAAGVVAARHSEGPAVTASMDEMVFLTPVRVGDVVHLRARLNWAGTSSMEVGVQVTADRWDEAVPPVHVATAYVVLVAVDASGNTRRVPGAYPETEEDRRRQHEALIRRQHRLARREEIRKSRSSKLMG